uniref:Uncharacterized protein n=1 Tax=Aegilops tauschii subsp. strangulata TaxID=200361 RepID=A0A453FFQ3_AEGTS
MYFIWKLRFCASNEKPIFMHACRYPYLVRSPQYQNVKLLLLQWYKRVAFWQVFYTVI